jgi:hypothetical protein
MSRKRIALTAGAVAAAIAVVAGGYALGAAGAPDAGEAAAQRQSAEQTAFREARSDAMAQARKRGIALGRKAGTEQGLSAGKSNGRADGAAQVKDEVHKLTLAANRRSESESEIGGIGGVPDLPGNGGVLVVGDSLEVLTSPYLKQYLKGSPLKVNAVGGYNSFQIFDLFQQSYDPSQSVIVFDSGTNDNPNYPEILAGRLQAVANIVGDRCMVVPTIHGLSVGGTNSAGKNRVVAGFVAARPGTQSPDWAGAVQAHPELMQADNLHPIAEGADLRARLIAQSIKACLNGGF